MGCHQSQPGSGGHGMLLCARDQSWSPPTYMGVPTLQPRHPLRVALTCWGPRVSLEGAGAAGTDTPPVPGPAPRCSWCRNWHFMVSKRSMALQAALEGAAAQGESWSREGDVPPMAPHCRAPRIPPATPTPPGTHHHWQRWVRLSRMEEPYCYGGLYPHGTTQACPQILGDLVPPGPLPGFLPGCGSRGTLGPGPERGLEVEGPGRDPAVPRLLLPPALLRVLQETGTPAGCSPGCCCCSGALHACNDALSARLHGTAGPCTLAGFSGALHARMLTRTLAWCNSALHTRMPQWGPARSYAATVPCTLTAAPCPLRVLRWRYAQHAHTLTPVPCTHTPLMFTIVRCTHTLLARSHLCPAHVPHSHACNIAPCAHPCTCMLPARNSALHTRPACTSTHACVGALHVCPHQCPTCTSRSHECCSCTHARHTCIPLPKQRARHRTLHTPPACRSAAVIAMPHTQFPLAQVTFSPHAPSPQCLAITPVSGLCSGSADTLRPQEH